jgi:hypothetical protein
MLRSARLAGSALVVALVTVCSAGPAFAATPATASSTPTAVIAAHGLGARLPTITFAPSATAPNVTATAAPNVTLPVGVDLRKWAVTPGNQGRLNSCVPWVIDYALLGWYSHFSGRVGQPFAPMYTYSQINGGGDYGSDASAALDLAVTQGNYTRTHYTQGDANWVSQPTAAERVNAAKFKVKGYSILFAGFGRTGTMTQLKTALATNHPVAIGMEVRSGFDLLGTGATAVDDDVSSAIRGYHEVLAVGYDAAGLIVQNSWGTGWANGGFGRISWRVVQTDVGDGATIGGFLQAATAPSVSAPAVVRSATTTARGTLRRVKVSWKGTAGNTGAITRYDAWYQVNGGKFAVVTLASPMSTSDSSTLRVGTKYRVAVRARAGTRLGATRFSAIFVA